LTAEEAFDLACHDSKVQSKVLPHDFNYTFSKFDDFEAYLDFTVDLPELSPEEKEAAKVKKEQEKREKESRREQKREERRKAEERKKAKLKKTQL